MDRSLLGMRVRKEQQVWDVLVATGALLRQIVMPSERLQHWPDQFLFRGRFVWCRRQGKGEVAVFNGGLEVLEK